MSLSACDSIRHAYTMPRCKGQNILGDFYTRVRHALAYPADDTGATLVVVLAIVAFGLLLAVILFALASPAHRDADYLAAHTEGDDGDEYDRARSL